METGNTRYEQASDPCLKFHQEIKDVRMGLLTFDQLQKTWVIWAKHVIEELESQAVPLKNNKLLDSQPTDTTV